MERRYEYALGRVSLGDIRADVLEFSPDGRFLFTWSYEDHKLRKHHSITLAEIRSITLTYPKDVYFLAVAPDGDSVFVAGSKGGKTSGNVYTIIDDPLIRMYDANTGRFVRTFKDDKTESTASALSVSPDGKRLLSGASSRVVLWDIETAEKLYEIEDQGTIGSLDFSPDGKQAVIGLGRAAHLFNLPSLDSGY